MNKSTACGLALIMAISGWAVGAEALKSGLQVGQKVGAFNVVKCGGALDDGIRVGAELCYR